MKHVEVEIMKALHLIQNICFEHGASCGIECPFSTSDGHCLITDNYPNRWNINDEGCVIWKGLL